MVLTKSSVRRKTRVSFFLSSAFCFVHLNNGVGRGKIYTAHRVESTVYCNRRLFRFFFCSALFNDVIFRPEFAFFFQCTSMKKAGLFWKQSQKIVEVHKNHPHRLCRRGKFAVRKAWNFTGDSLFRITPTLFPTLAPAKSSQEPSDKGGAKCSFGEVCVSGSRITA